MCLGCHLRAYGVNYVQMVCAYRQVAPGRKKKRDGFGYFSKIYSCCRALLFTAVIVISSEMLVTKCQKIVISGKSKK